eukprot:c11670_g1_i1 orf=119-1228(+)
MQQGAGDESPFSAEHTVKRLDFESSPVVSTTQTISTMRAQALQIRRDLDRCRDDVPDPTELIESLKVAAAEHANVDTSKLWEKFLLLKKEFLQVEAENLFLESFLKPEGESTPENVTESELRALEKQLADLRSTSVKETEEIKSLIGAFAAEMEDFPNLMKSALNHFDECDEKMQLLESSEIVQDHTDETSLLLNTETDADLEREARKLSILAGTVEVEILELDAKIGKQVEYYKHIQNLQNTYTKLDLLSKVLAFFSDWTIVGYENNVVILAFKSSATNHKKATQNMHRKPVKEVVYKLHVKVHPKTLAVENAQLEPRNEALIDDILKEMVFRRMMHSLEVSAEPHNDLEFLLRRVGQQITSSRKSGA